VTLPIQALGMLSKHGAVILRNCVPRDAADACQSAVSELVQAFVQAAQESPDGLNGAKVDNRKLGIVRVAKIGDGEVVVRLTRMASCRLAHDLDRGH
jgi:hypothetical protein